MQTEPKIILISIIMKSDIRQRIMVVVNLAKEAFHWGFLPTVLYLGFKRGADPGMPAITPLSLLWQ